MKEVPRVFTALPYTDIARPVGRVPNGLGGCVVILISFWTQISPIAPSFDRTAFAWWDLNHKPARAKVEWVRVARKLHPSGHLWRL
jgi:hypothetical protein